MKQNYYRIRAQVHIKLRSLTFQFSCFLKRSQRVLRSAGILPGSPVCNNAIVTEFILNGTKIGAQLSISCNNAYIKPLFIRFGIFPTDVKLITFLYLEFAGMFATRSEELRVGKECVSTCKS